MANPHPMPPCRDVGGHDQCPPDFHVQDDELVAVTEGSLLGAAIRVVAGYDPLKDRFSRTRVSFQIYRGLELGWAHMAVDNASDILWDISTRIPKVAQFAWPDHATEMKQYNVCEGIVSGFRGLDKMPHAYDWLAAGWYQIAPRGDVQSVYTERWYKDIAAKAIDWCRSDGIRDKRILVAGIRARNTSGTKLETLKRMVRELGETEGLKRFLVDYAHDSLTRALWEWPIFDGPIDKYPEPSDIRWPRETEPLPPALKPGDTVQKTPGAPAVTYTSNETWGDKLLELPWKWIGIGTLGVGAVGGGIAGLVWYLKKRKKGKRKKKR